jgi:thiol-disulfide isomerase/thioredoxin
MSKNARKTFKQHVVEWLVTIAVGGGILYFFAPPSWWQFGPLDASDRKPTPAFALPRAEGGSWDFGETRGRVVLVNYWATWCGPCRFETPGLVNIAKEFRERGVEVVGVNVDEDRSLITPFVEKYGIDYPILRPGPDPQIGDGPMSLPTSFLYDKQGRLAKKYTGIVLESTLRSDINELLAE